MRITKTLGWVQSHPQHAEVRVNVQTRAINDDSTVAMANGEDVVLTDPEILAAAQRLEALVAHAVGADLPSIEAPVEDPTRKDDDVEVVS